MPGVGLAKTTGHLAAGRDTAAPSCHDDQELVDWRPRRGHYISVNRFDGSAEMIGALKPGVMGIQKRYAWAELEPLPDSYDLSAIRADLDMLEKRDVQLVVFLEDKSFDGTSPAPAYLENYVLENRHGGLTLKRWEPYVIERMGKLFAAIGRAFDCSRNFEGLALQESALGIEDQTLEVNGYSPVAYRDALTEILITAAESMPRSQIFWYMNFLPGRQRFIADIASAITAAGVAMGGPDVLPDDKPLGRLVYPFYERFKGKLILFNSIQYNSYGHLHNETTRPTRYWTPEELFLYARDELHVSYLFWNRKTWRKPPDSYDWTDALPVIEATGNFARP